jgi:NAD(P)H-dependent nitrite reductase small subunit
MPEYHAALRASDLPNGASRSVNVEGRRIAVFNVAGTIRAIDNECPHVGAPLAEGTVSDGRVACALHGWKFDLATGACSTNPNCAVQVFPTRVADDRIEIEI